jgi:hypothetical protein
MGSNKLYNLISLPVLPYLISFMCKSSLIFTGFQAFSVGDYQIIRLLSAETVYD